jgi:hypothetical protein
MKNRKVLLPQMINQIAATKAVPAIAKEAHPNQSVVVVIDLSTGSGS